MATAPADPKLLAAARSAFTKFGYRGATVERIAAEAGLSRVTLHRRGISKELLLQWLVEDATVSYRSSLWPVLTAAGTGRDRLGRALRALCAAAEQHMPLLLALQALTDEVFHDDSEQALTRTEFTEPLERLLLDGAADGSLRVSDPAETATVLFNLVGWTYLHLRTGHRWPAERAARATVDVALHGVVAGRTNVS